MTWFEKLMGFREENPDQVRSHLVAEGSFLRSQRNGKVWRCRELETPTLAELRERVKTVGLRPGTMTVREVVAEVQHLHRDPANADALFQVASQFNLLEMISSHVTPDQGVGRYEHDPTQGPACSIAAGAGTIYRNYLATVNGQIGQSTTNQIDCLADIGLALGNTDNRLWEMRNGYALASQSGLVEISDHLKSRGESEMDNLRQLLRIGIQWNAQVTLGNSIHNVSQAYCSALPVAYSPHSADQWVPFARLVLDASYEATICAAILNSAKTANNHLFITLLGGGAFGNKEEWIMMAIRRSLMLYEDLELNVAIVSRSRSQESVRKLVSCFQETKGGGGTSYRKTKRRSF